MKVTNGQIWKLGISYGKKVTVLDKLAEVCLPASLAYKRNKLVKDFAARFKDIVKVHDDIVVRLGKQDSNGNYKIDPKDEEAISKFLAEEKELMDIEEEIEITKIPLESLDRLELDYAESEAVSFLIDFGEDEREESSKPVSEDTEEPIDK